MSGEPKEAIDCVAEFDGFDMGDRPAAGTACARCRRFFAHFCPAKGYAGADPLCMACGTGQRCGQVDAVLRMERSVGYELGELEAAELHGECRVLEVAAETPPVTPSALPSAWAAFKATLSKDNLAGRRVKVQRPLSEKKLKRERDAGRRRRMAETVEVAVKMGVDEARNFALLNDGVLSAEEIARRTGQSAYHVRRWIAEAGDGHMKAVAAAGKTVKRGAFEIETISLDDVPRDPLADLSARLRVLGQGQAIRLTAGSKIAAAKMQKAALAACDGMAGLQAKRVRRCPLLLV